MDAFEEFARRDLEAKGVEPDTAAQVVADTYRSQVDCWCGRTVAQGVRHYPGGDPENGPAHLPRKQHPDQEPVR